MHNCPPPKDALNVWLDPNGTIHAGVYGHLLLEQKSEIDDALINALRPYFESAHRDAREYFDNQIGINLHPDAGGTLDIAYPNCLPDKAKRGLFGEVMAGLVTEAYQEEFVGGHAWRVPIFLFRKHEDVENYLWALKFDRERKREIYGRHGTDFIGISLNRFGEVVRVIVGEAKWRKSLTDSALAELLYGEKVKNKETGVSEHNGRGIWFGVNRDSPIPWGLRQLQRLLEHRDPMGHASAIYSIDRAVLGVAPPPPRTDLILIAGDGAKRRKKGMVLIDHEEVPADYTAGNDLQVVEVILDGGEALISALYSSLWEDAYAGT
ncbi:hypothetical protein [Azospirillum sp. Marseille-Q6669]